MSDMVRDLPANLRSWVLPFLLLVGGAGPSGCASLPLPDALASEAPQAATGWKHVAEKRDPVYLVAVDGTECTVSRARFERVERGDRILCTWR